MDKQEKIKILYVDDEANNLVGFKASFRINYNVFVANSAVEAIQQLEKHPDIRVIFCDQRMPEKTGVQLFEEIRLDFPHPIRILLTGYADIESVIDAINKGNVFRYIKKPWTDADIITAIDEANKYYMANSMLAIKNEELQTAYDELDKFAYSVTHDMRGPLLSILGAIDVAGNINNINDLREMLSLMEITVRKLDNFIKNIHDYYDLKRGELTISDIDFNAVARDQEDFYKVTTRVNNIKFIKNISQSEPFRCDYMSLNVILNNLLSNAFKYQRKNIPDKFVELNISVNKGIATIIVKDNGIGIPQNYIGSIFNMFFRANSEEVGSGFGLYNVKDALRKLNGDVKVDSIENEGTTFTVIIPSK